jgi:lipopolysaccharide/colanic/teichoic acid biosynthesis glycosyltransferase
MLLTPLRVPSILFDGEKRLLDITLCVCLAPIALLLIALGALAVRLSSPGPIFFIQQRLGRFGKPFRLIKLRTMSTLAEANGQQWAATDDTRVTGVGRFLRASGIDELPQLWNILRGEMSLVGPRPETPVIAQHLEAQIPFYQARQLVLPGITGWAQLHQGGDASLGDVASKLRYDLYHLKYASLALDVRILLATLQMLLHMAKPAPIATVSYQKAYQQISG